MNKDEMIKDLTSLIDSYEIKTLANAQFVARQIVEKCNYRKVADDEEIVKTELLKKFVQDEEHFRDKAKFYYERCKSYGCENFYDAELEWWED